MSEEQGGEPWGNREALLGSSVALLEPGCSLLPASLPPKIHRPGVWGRQRGPGGSPSLQRFICEKEGANVVYLHHGRVLVVSWNRVCFGPGAEGCGW